jgi:HEAT repeat protein
MAAEALGAIGPRDQAALDALNVAQRDPDANVRRAVFQALERIKRNK